ncbi:MAG TPA: response regulator [Bacteroidia bacterium]|jgi:two-component system response regulator LytT|nr:response regulator [Bacteroidia bacterium]
MKRTSVLIVEDEIIIAKDLTLTLNKLGYNVIGHCITGEDAAKTAGEKQPDIILMDIMLKGDMTGINAAKIVRDKYNIPVIFITAYSDEDSISRANTSAPFGYIVKPFKANDLRATIETALNRFNEEQTLKRENEMLYKLAKSDDKKSILFIKSDSKLIKLKTKDILYIEALKDYVNIYTVDNKFVIRSTMKGIQDKLPADKFARVHRSFIVAVDKVSTIDHAIVVMENNATVPLGGLYKDEFLEKINTV